MLDGTDSTDTYLHSELEDPLHWCLELPQFSLKVPVSYQLSYPQVWMGSGHVWVALLNGAECIGWDASVVILNVSLSPQQGGSRCHHNLTVCWTSHDRAISGPGLPTCCQFHWSQSSQIINNVPAPHLHLRLTPPLIQYISHWHCVALWTFSDDVMAPKLLACAKSFFVCAVNCGIKHD